MRVPLITNMKFAHRPVRTADVFPTILSLLGHDIPGHIDGKRLI
jgi:arylsulfatase A-like enzyme